MSEQEYKTFYEESQKEYKMVQKSYVPMGYPNASQRYELRPKGLHQICPKCGCMVTYPHEYKWREIHGGTFNGVPVIYEMERTRCMCSRCNETFVISYENLPRGYKITTEAENYIIWSLGSMPMSMIASSIGVSTQTISNRAVAYGRAEQETMLNCRYRYLSIDEVYLGKNKDGSHRIYWVLNDISTPWKSNNILLNLGRTKEEVIKQLKRLKHPESVMAVCIDMWQPYAEAISAVFPNAAIVIDKFHVVKAAKDILNQARKAAKCSKSLKDDMKDDAAIFLTPLYKLNDDELASLDGYLRADKTLETVYFLIQEFLTLYQMPDYEAALEFLCKWETEVHQSGINLSIYDTICNWLPYIVFVK